MGTVALRPASPATLRERAHPSVETLLERIAALARERQTLRERGAAPTALERNRLALGRRQRDLSHALIARHLGASERP